jgi:hypothetical protein
MSQKQPQSTPLALPRMTQRSVDRALTGISASVTHPTSISLYSLRLSTMHRSILWCLKWQTDASLLNEAPRPGKDSLVIVLIVCNCWENSLNHYLLLLTCTIFGPGDPEHEKTTFANSLSPSQILQWQFKQGTTNIVANAFLPPPRRLLSWRPF